MSLSVYPRIGAFALAIALCTSQVLAQTASSPSNGSISGIVADQVSGLGISAAHVVLFAGDRLANTTDTDSRGRFLFKDVNPGIYHLSATALNYGSQGSGDVAVISGQENVVSFVLVAQQGSTGSLKTIATTRTSARGALASTTAITRTLDPQVLQSEGYIRFGDQLRTLPGVNLGGLSSSVGDDLYINIRGLGESETQALLDGHPVGPIGVYAINGGGGNFPNAFNFADTPSFGIRNVQVTFGSGASGLYGTDAIGGTINMETLNPTQEQRFTLSQAAGDEEKTSTVFTGTGTLGKFGYAVAGGIQGTTGLFPYQTIAQTGRPNNNSTACQPNPPPPPINGPGSPPFSYADLTTCNLALNTYPVSGQTTVRSALGKLTYALSKNTTALVSWYGSGQWADSTGNGDNDNIPYDTRLAQVQAAQPGLDSRLQCALPSDPAGTTSGIVVATDSNPQACYSPTQVAQASYGPFGGGQGRARGTSMFDYHGRLQSVSGRSTYTLDYFFNHYKFTKTSEEAAGLNGDGTCCGGTVFTQFLNSQGVLISDDIVNDKSDIGFGYFVEHQVQNRLNFQGGNGGGSFSYVNPAYPSYASGFVKGSYDMTPTTSVYANAWVKRSSVDSLTSFDPRVSLVFRPHSGHDVFRATFGHSTGDPAAELVQAGINVTGNPSSLNPSCTPFNNIGTAGNPILTAERANDVELGYAHSFAHDSSIQLNLYSTNVQNQIIAQSIPVLSVPGGVTIDPTLLADFAGKVASAGCPGVTRLAPNSVLPFLSVTDSLNVANAQYRGIEISGRQRFSRRFYVDYTYDVQNAVQNGLSDFILQNNPFMINGAQIEGIPYAQGTLAFDYSTPQGWEAHADGYFVSRNNVSQRAPYSFWSGFVGHTTNGFNIRLGVFNIFNQATQNYGYFGHQALIPENKFFTDTNSIQQFVNTGSGEQFGLASRAFTLTFNQAF